MPKTVCTQNVSQNPALDRGRSSSRKPRQPYAWLGAGAVALGVGAALAGAGVAHADGSPAAGPSASAKSQGAGSTGKSARHGSTTTISPKPVTAQQHSTPPVGRTVASTALTERPASAAAVSPRARIHTTTPAAASGTSSPTIGYATYPRQPLDPNNYGPVLGALVRLVNEIDYITTDVKPRVKPFQLPSTPGQAVIAGTFGAYTPNGDPFSVTVTAAPTNGTVTIAPTGGYYVYTPNPTIAATGGTDTFTIAATDTGYHPIAELLGIRPRAVTVTVPVRIAAPGVQSLSDTGDTAYYVMNTSYQPMQVAGYLVNQASLSPAVGQVIQSPATASDSGQTQGLFEIAPGKTVTVYLNPVGIIHEGVVANYYAASADALAISPDGSNIYVTNAGGKSISVIDAATGLTSSTIPVGSYPYGIAVTPDGSRLYVNNDGDSTVSVIDVASNVVTATIATGKSPYRIAVSPDGKYAYTANGGDNTVSVINIDPSDPNYNTVTATIGVGLLPSGIAVSPDNKYVYVTNYSDNTVSVINVASNTVIDTIAGFTAPFGVAVSPNGSRIYVTGAYDIANHASSNSVSVVDAATRTIDATIGVGNDPLWVAVSPDGNSVYVTNAASNTMSVINTDLTSPSYNTVVNTIAVGTGPQAVIFRPDGTAGYVANSQSNSVSKIAFDTSGTPTDGGTYRYVVTMTGGSTPGCSAAGSNQCPVAGTTSYLEDPPGTIYYIPSTQPQQQSDVLQNLVSDDLSNATFYTKSEARIGYTNPLKAQGFSPYINNTSSPSTSTYTVSTTTTTASSSTWNVSVKVTQEEKMGTLTLKAEEGASYTWGTTTTNSQTYTQAVTQTVQPGETLYLYTETPVYRFYGDWNVLYGNTTYYLQDVWYDTPYAADSLYPSYIAAYTCQTGSPQCTQLASGDLTGYPDSFPTSAPTYPVAESDVDSSYNSAATAQTPSLSASSRRWPTISL
ncbi:hypothetical protein BayCH28_12500 [Mycolicibacterium sp. CH28]|uniref:YncE family protein n=1 Tax=Mycolicibacterium sp. CH28 TaxID=2512237 RepID=UPI001081CE34|nr:YncE family protein [Mycolicibacterium sp. CH28]TGD88532.1 hypothetical protein BayCH28_12500 [Mycolicibacterium sp. CH28]